MTHFCWTHEGQCALGHSDLKGSKFDIKLSKSVVVKKKKIYIYIV